MARVLIVQHIPCETPGILWEVFKRKGLSAECLQTFKSQGVPEDGGGARGLVLMGGPMGVYEQERYPFLRQEARLIEKALKEQRPILGICLGSQLLAAVLGAKVTKGKGKEIGWHTVRLTEAARTDRLWKGVESPFVAYHWHGDVFELPSGAVGLASSDRTECQAFCYGPSAYGFLFHMEVTKEVIGAMVRAFAGELREEGISGQEIMEKAKDHLAPLQEVGRKVFQRWAELVAAGSGS